MRFCVGRFASARSPVRRRPIFGKFIQTSDHGHTFFLSDQNRVVSVVPSKEMNQSMIPGSKRKRNEQQEVSFESLVSPNFEELSRRFPDFGRAYRAVQHAQKTNGGSFASHITQDFSVALTKALLHVHWGLSLTHVPMDRLCPPVPNRYFYVQWIQRDLLPLLRNTAYFHTKSLSHTGLDIGTGATCIYPLLFVASIDSYKLYATDIDAESVKLAKQNVADNRLQTSIEVLLVPPSDVQQQQEENDNMRDDTSVKVGPMRRSIEQIPVQHRALDFVMTNPPFYDDNINSERTDLRAGDRRQRTAMSVNEGSYPGGEVGFVLDILVDSLYLYVNGEQPPSWCSCMCGKKVSWNQLKHIVTQLLGPAHVCATEFGPSHLTRWFLAWTFCRPQIRSPLAQMEPWGFQVSMDGAMSPRDAVSEVCRRIQEYCQNYSDQEFVAKSQSLDSSGKRRIIIYEASPKPEHSSEYSLPPRVETLLSQMDPALRHRFLPIEGRFLLDVTVALSGSNQVQVHIEAYQHSHSGKKVVERIKLQLQNEICRTNRRWRRKLKREQQEQAQAMDES